MCGRASRSSGWVVALIALLVSNGCTTPDKVATLDQYAPQSPDADIDAVSLSASDENAFDPARVGTEFPDTTQQVAVWYRWKGADSGKKVGIRWSKDGQVVLEQGDTLAKVSGASSYILKMAAGSKLPIGKYQVELLEDGVAVTKIPFKVGDGGTDGAAPSGAAAASEDSADTGLAAPAVLVAEREPPSSEESAEVPAPAVQPPVAMVSQSAGALASRETKWPGIVVELTEFTRKGNTLTAKLRFTNRGPEEARPSFYYSETYLLDLNNQKIDVLKDDQGHYLGALTSGHSDWWGDQLKPGASQTVWMRFPAPAGANVLTLQVPGMDPFGRTGSELGARRLRLRSVKPSRNTRRSSSSCRSRRPPRPGR